MTLHAYVGSRTTRERHARGEGISVFAFDAASGALERIQIVEGLVNPSYLALSAAGHHLYSVHGDRSEVSAFAVDRASGRLSFLNQQGTEGHNPVHLALDPSGRFLVVTNHLGASLAVLPIGADGALEPLVQLVTVSGPIGPHRFEQQQAKPHFNPFDPSGRWVIVPDKGLDRIFSFRFDAGRLTPAATPFVQAREGAGPRNAVVHPSLPLAYVVNELDSTLTTYRFDAQMGALEALHLITTLPPTFTGNSRAAGIAIDGAGRCLYTSNRGHDSIAAFRLDRQSGLPRFVEAQPTLGRTPRFFTLTPDGRMLYALNEDSDTIVAFDVDDSGKLAAPRVVADCGSPVCMVFSNEN
ncbi:lactonase family protein [Piscinibacter sakaiensis]|uniref:lactonase family protein n=1 Tax=Piscinibacter sakaiensis TaxID=1547922 RepID=UPI003AB05B4B